MTDTTHKGAAHLTTADFKSTIMNSSTPVMVDFFAVWCGPCKVAGPIIDKLADEFAGKVTIAKLDVDENIEIAREYGVSSIPTVMMFKKNGDQIEVVDTQVGFNGEPAYRTMINKVVAA